MNPKVRADGSLKLYGWFQVGVMLPLALVAAAFLAVVMAIRDAADWVLERFGA